MKSRTFTAITLLALVASSFVASSAAAHQSTTSDLLLPYFEIDLSGAGLTTYFAVVNSSPDPVRARIGVYTNWGVALLSTSIELEGEEVRTINLSNWVLEGRLPDRTLTPEELEHLQAALTGQRSPQNDLFYSTETETSFEKAIGFVTIHVDSQPRADVLFGDYFVVDPSQNFAQGEVLIDIDPALHCPNLCLRHALRYLLGGGFDDGTQVLIWTGLEGQPSGDGLFPKDEMTPADILIYKESGELIETRRLDLMPLEVLTVADLDLPANFGWLDLETDHRTFMAVRHSAQDRFSVGLQTFCLPKRQGPPPPTGSGPDAGVSIEKSTNGFDADQAPGPAIGVGEPVLWEYVVHNTGDTPLFDIVVTDDQGVAVSCPEDSLGIGDTMVCTGSGTATPGQYGNVGTVTARGPANEPVEDSDPSHYHGESDPPPASIDIEKATNGQDADEAPGPPITEGSPVEWTYVVTNTGGTGLDQIAVTDDKGVAVSCPGNTLEPGQSMTCTGNGTAVEGQYENIGSVVGRSPQGELVEDSDPSHYNGGSGGGGEDPRIDIEKATNGHDADRAPGPTILEGDPVTWTYVVTNTGNVALNSITVSDDQGVAVACPETELALGQSMTCTGNGTAIDGQYANIGSVTGQSPQNATVTDSDPSHYLGYHVGPGTPRIDIEKATNGHDADAAPGPSIDEGDAVTWTYVVTNIGDVTLTSIAVSDDQGVAVSCPKSTLAEGEAMTCTGNGTAIQGQYQNLGTAIGQSPEGAIVDDSDPSHYYGESESPAIDIEKATNGHDADAAPGPSIDEGDAVTWTYVVTNTGDVTLTSIAVSDDQGVAVSCPKSTLEPGEAMTCTGHGTAIQGQYQNLGTATGESPKGTTVDDSDPSHYYGEALGAQGCTPGYWKNHLDSWAAAGINPDLLVGSVFGSASAYPGIASASLVEALDFGGGSGVEGGARNLLRAAVAAILNASHPGVNYPSLLQFLYTGVDQALASGDRDAMLSLAAALDSDNNGGCPLN